MADYSKDFQIAYDDARDACTIRFRCFDTPNSVTVHGQVENGLNVEDLLLQVRRDCLDMHHLWSFSLDGSDIARVNGCCASAKVDIRTSMLIAAMKDFHAAEPAFDFTVGPISYVWKRARRLPSADELAEALSHVGADKVTLQGGDVVKTDPLAQVDVGGAAKGFAADSVAARLRAAGVRSAEIDFGGNLFMVGAHPSGRPWRVAVRVPEGIAVEHPVVEVCDKSVVTSGSYERFIELEGQRYQHIVDVATGMPSKSDVISATVVADSSLQADMLATVALLAGTEGLSGLKARHPEALFVAITAEGQAIR